MELQSDADMGYLKFDQKRFYWAVALGEKAPYNRYDTCTMKPTGAPLTYELVMAGNEDLFNEPITVPEEWKLQLQEKDSTDNIACVKSFIIPPKPNEVEVSQLRNVKYEINDTLYDVPDYNHPYAMLSIKDDFFLYYENLRLLLIHTVPPQNPLVLLF